MKCPWCDSEASFGGKLCKRCLDRAKGIASLDTNEYDNLPYGIIGLDPSGTILSFNSAEAKRSGSVASKVVGRNFFRDIAPCAQVQEYEGRFKRFLESDQDEEEFGFTYTFPHETVRVYLVFVRVDESAMLIVSKERVA